MDSIHWIRLKKMVEKFSCVMGINFAIIFSRKVLHTLLIVSRMSQENIDPSKDLSKEISVLLNAP